MNTVHPPATRMGGHGLRGPGRLAFNEQLCFFGPANDTASPTASLGLWAILALALAIVPWALVGLAIWMFT